MTTGRLAKEVIPHRISRGVAKSDRPVSALRAEVERDVVGAVARLAA